MNVENQTIFEGDTLHIFIGDNYVRGNSWI